MSISDRQILELFLYTFPSMEKTYSSDKNNTIKKQCVQFNTFFAPVRKLNTSFIIMFFKFLNNLKSVWKKVKSVLNNLLNGTPWKAQTNFYFS